MAKERWQAAKLAGNATLVFLPTVLLLEDVSAELRAPQRPQCD